MGDPVGGERGPGDHGAVTGAGKNTIYKRQFDALAAVRGENKSALDGGQFFKRRTALFAECLDVMNRLWTEDKFAYDGQFYKFGGMTLGIARPRQNPPFWLPAASTFRLKASARITTPGTAMWPGR